MKPSDLYKSTEISVATDAQKKEFWDNNPVDQRKLFIDMAFNNSRSSVADVINHLDLVGEKDKEIYLEYYRRVKKIAKERKQ